MFKYIDITVESFISYNGNQKYELTHYGRRIGEGTVVDKIYTMYYYVRRNDSLTKKILFLEKRLSKVTH